MAKILTMSAGNMDLIDQDLKFITLRDGHRDFQPGDKIVICCPSDGRAVLATVIECSHVTYETISPRDYIDDGFTSLVDAYYGMKSYYSHITWVDNVTSVRWRRDWN